MDDLKVGTADSKRDARGRWKKGVSGNEGGSQGLKLAPILRKALEAVHDGDRTKAERFVEIGIEKALAGDFQYWKEIWNRIDGRVVERVMTAQAHGEVQVRWEEDELVIREYIGDAPTVYNVAE